MSKQYRYRALETGERWRLTYDDGKTFQGVDPLRDHPYVAPPQHPEPVAGCVTMPDWTMYPQFAPGQLVFYCRPNWGGVGAIERAFVLRLDGRVVVRNVGVTSGGLTLFGHAAGTRMGEDGAVLLRREEKRPDRASGWLHSRAQILGVALTDRALATEYAYFLQQYRAVGERWPSREEVATALFSEHAERRRAPLARALPSLFHGWAN